MQVVVNPARWPWKFRLLAAPCLLLTPVVFFSGFGLLAALLMESGDGGGCEGRCLNDPVFVLWNLLFVGASAIALSTWLPRGRVPPAAGVLLAAGVAVAFWIMFAREVI